MKRLHNYKASGTIIAALFANSFLTVKNFILITGLFLLFQGSSLKKSDVQIDWSGPVAFESAKSGIQLHPMGPDSVLLYQENYARQQTELAFFKGGQMLWKKDVLPNEKRNPYNLFVSDHQISSLSIAGNLIELGTYSPEVGAFNTYQTVFEVPGGIKPNEAMNHFSFNAPRHAGIQGFSYISENAKGYELETKVYKKSDYSQLYSNSYSISNEDLNKTPVYRAIDDDGTFYILFRAHPDKSVQCENCYMVMKFKGKEMISSEMIKFPKGSVSSVYMTVNEKQDQIHVIAGLNTIDNTPSGHAFIALHTSDLNVFEYMRFSNMSQRFEVEKPESGSLKEAIPALGDWTFNVGTPHASKNDNYTFLATYTKERSDKKQNVLGSIMLYQYSSEFKQNWFKRNLELDTCIVNVNFLIERYTMGIGFVVLSGSRFNPKTGERNHMLMIYDEQGRMKQISVPKIEGKMYELVDVTTSEDKIYLLVKNGSEYRYGVMSLDSVAF